MGCYWWQGRGTLLCCSRSGRDCCLVAGVGWITALLCSGREEMDCCVVARQSRLTENPHGYLAWLIKCIVRAQQVLGVAVFELHSLIHLVQCR